MIHFYFALALTLLALALGGYTLTRQSQRPGVANPFLPVALLPALIVALMAPVYAHFFYKGTVGLALLLLVVGAAMLLIPGTPRVVGQATLVLIYFLLWVGMSITVGRALWSLPGLAGLLPLALAGLVGWWLGRSLVARRLSDLRWTVFAYAFNVGLALGAATVLAIVQPGLWSLLALASVLTLAAVDLLRAWDMWRAPVRRAVVWTSGGTLLSVLILAWSVWGPRVLEQWRA
jgi:hypothetical protein